VPKWTLAGIARLDAEIAGLRRKLAEFASMKHDSNLGRNFSGEDCRSDINVMRAEESSHASRLAAKLHERLAIEPAARVTQTDRIVIGSQVTIAYLESPRRKAGDREVIILGGDGESDTSSSPHTVSGASPLGRALLRKEVGDEVSYECPSGKVVVEIENIEIPADTQAPQLAHAA